MTNPTHPTPGQSEVDRLLIKRVAPFVLPGLMAGRSLITLTDTELAAIIAAARAEGPQPVPSDPYGPLDNRIWSDVSARSTSQPASSHRQEEVERLRLEVIRLMNVIADHVTMRVEYFARAQVAQVENARLKAELTESKRRCKELQVEHDGLRRSEREWRKKVIEVENNLKK